jgi:signal transduction histidine kinase
VKLAQKLSLTLVVGVLIVVAAFAYPRIRRETSLFENDMRRDHVLMGTILSAVLADVWILDGEKRALAVLDRANASKEGVSLRWIWFDEPRTSTHGPWLDAAHLRGVSVKKPLQLISAQSVPALLNERAEFMFTVLPLNVPGGRAGALEISESLAPRAAYVRSTIYNMLFSSGITALVCGIVAAATGRWFVGRPVSRLIAKARNVGSGDLSTPLILNQGDEFGQLAAEFNLMCERLAEATATLKWETAARIEALEQLRHADRLTALGRLTSAIAHELGTPINVISGHAQLLAKGRLGSDAAVDTASIVMEQCERMTRTVRQILNYSRRREPKKSTILAGDVVTSVVAMLRPIAEKSGIELAVNIESGCAIHVDPIQMQQALTNLLINGIHASPVGATVSIDVVSVDSGQRVEINVIDHGSGISEADLPHIFEPFFTTKESGEGTGLGLSIAKDIIAEHGGEIHVDSVVGRGTRFEVVIPQAEQP